MSTDNLILSSIMTMYTSDALLCFYVLHTSMQKIKILILVAITILTSVYGYSGLGSDAFASHGSNAIACETDGYEAGRDGSFSQKLYETCEEVVGGADAYYGAL